MRSELMCVNEQLLFGDTQFYNVLITSHAMLMIFWFVMPILLGGFGNLYLPSMLGVPEMVFPRLNNVSIVLLPLAGQFLIGSFIADEGCGSG